MEDMKVYIEKIAELGEQKGAWFFLPANREEVTERLGAGQPGDCVIREFYLPFEIHDDMTLEELNSLSRQAQELEDHGAKPEDFKYITQAFYNSFQEMAAAYPNEIRFYVGTTVEQLVEESDRLGTIDEVKRRFGIQDEIKGDLVRELTELLRKTGLFLETGNGVYEQIN